MPDVALAGILRLVKKIMVKRRPIQIVFRPAGVHCTAKPSYIHLQIQVKRMIREIHKMRQMHIRFGDRGLLLQFPVRKFSA